MVDMNTRTALLDSAEAMVRSHGLDAISFADLSKQVGIRKASVHYHFPTKADMALHVLQRYVTRFEEKLEQIAQSTDPITDYVALYRAALGDGEQLCLCVALAGARAGLDAPVLDALAQFHQRSLNWLTERYRALSHADPEHAAAATLAQVEGAQILARATGNATDFDRATALIANSQRSL